MKLSNIVISLICLSSMMLILGQASRSNIEDNLNLSSINIIDKNTESVIKSSHEESSKEDKIQNEKELKEKKDRKEKKLKQEEIERKNSVTYVRNNIKIASNISKEEMKNVLLTYNGSSTMAHLADALVDSEKKYGVNSFVMAAIVALESGFATSRRAVEDNNLTGYEVYSDDSEGRLFSSQYESVVQTARHLSQNYLTKGAIHYNGMSVDAVQIKYCPDEGKDKQWETKVDKLASGFLKKYKEIYVYNK